MGCFYRRIALSTLAAALVAIILVASLTGVIVYLTGLQQQIPKSGAETIEEVSEKVRENLDAKLSRSEKPSSNTYIFYINAINTGAVSLKITGAVFTKQDGSVAFVSINPPVDMPMLAERTITVQYTGEEPAGIGLKTERGNIFAVRKVTATERRPSAAPAVTFLAEGLGSDVSGVVLVVDGVSYFYSDLPVSFTWDENTEHTFSWFDPISAGSGKQYVWVSTNGLSSEKSGVIIAPPDGGVVVATYKIQYQITVGVSPAGAGTTNPQPGSYWYDAGSIVSVSATPYSGFTFDKWLLDGANAGSRNPITVLADAPHTLTAVFGGTAYTLTIYVYYDGTSTPISGVVVKIDGNSYITDSSGVISVLVVPGSHTVEVPQNYISAYTRRIFTKWDDGSTSNPKTITVSSSMSMTAYMKLQHYLTMQANPSGGGSVSPSSGWKDAWSLVSISATPNSGYTFDYWIGSGAGSYTGSSSSATIAMDEPITQTAYFFSFSISVSPSSGSTTPGGSVTAIVTATYLYGYNPKTISFSASGLPSGVSASFSPSSVTISPSSPTATSTMTITTSSSTPTGTYSVTITGSGGGVTKTTTYTLTISSTSPPPSFDFSISIDPSSISLCRGASKTATVTVSAVSGSGTVTLSASGLPSGVTASFSPSSGTPTFTSTLTLTASSTVSLGTYTVTITGSGGGVTKTATLTLYVNDFSISVSPTSGTYEIPSSGSASYLLTTITLSSPSSSGSVQEVTLSASGAPSGVTITFNPSSTSFAPGSTAYSYMYAQISSSASPGTYTITIAASSNCGASKTATYTLTLTRSFDFSISVSPSYIPLCRGASKTATVTVTLVSGSSQTVSLSASGLPSGVTASFNPQSGNPTFTSTLTLSASSVASLGSYTVTISGSGGGVTRSATLTLYVNDFSVSLSQSTVNVPMPSSGSTQTQVTVTVSSTSGSGSSQTISLSASGAPSGVSVSFSPSSITVSPGSSATSTMTITVSSSATPGSYTITVAASSDCGTSKTTQLTLNILVRVAVYGWDREYNLAKRFANIYVEFIGIGSGYIGDSGYIEFYAPVGYSGTLRVSPTATSYGGAYSLSFWKWGNGATTREITITVDADPSKNIYSAFYKVRLNVISPEVSASEGGYYFTMQVWGNIEYVGFSAGPKTYTTIRVTFEYYLTGSTSPKTSYTDPQTGSNGAFYTYYTDSGTVYNNPGDKFRITVNPFYWLDNGYEGATYTSQWFPIPTS